jgi:hypothetical protein
VKRTLPVAAMVALLFALPAFAKSGSHSGSHNRSNSSSTSHAPKQSRKATGITRDSKGRIRRSPEAKHEFRKSHPCPSTGRTSGRCPGFVVDHVQALKHGGADAPSNMQWQSTEAAKAKDKVE